MWAMVKEVFISHRLNIWGRRFGFVRFFDMDYVGRLERELSQSLIGSRKLYVNIPRYRRNELDQKARRQREVRKHNGYGFGNVKSFNKEAHKQHERGSDSRKSRNTAVWRENKGKEV